jgi:hypothetical protein
MSMKYVRLEKYFAKIKNRHNRQNRQPPESRFRNGKKIEGRFLSGGERCSDLFAFLAYSV